MKNFMIKAWTKMMVPVRNERGAQSLEWLGLAALLILVLGIVSQAVSTSSSSIGDIITNILKKISAMVG
ncbi:hypothetical protein G3A_01695 [Bacillus sp. 17376]|uniref:Uncharacterized protein n=1 Tax=Mesobacillus boroniphilus JCM 21738 TaxID=1294265 RepID=W4RQE3_9BACI|nr:hypothetical protein [Mesobacillus boroniphilus]ESU34314.1 hypothetical protein G3A_01695 [Bacillus sp. 17376]GAE46660.1 hypothetical protein JCM21738_3578 [Mesobacillus boroniphilus JCM 21738]